MMLYCLGQSGRGKAVTLFTLPRVASHTYAYFFDAGDMKYGASTVAYVLLLALGLGSRAEFNILHYSEYDLIFSHYFGDDL